MKILQIDDSPQICDMYADMFAADNNSIQSVNDGKEGLELVLKNNYDLILLDILMPKFNGMDFLQELKELRSSELKKIVVTSLLEFNESQIKELMSFGIHSVEGKPSSFQQLESLQKRVSKNKAEKTLSQPRLLIIDSKQETTKMLKDFFDSNGFSTTVTNDSFDGLSYIQKEHWDVVLLDIYMPGFTGLQIIRMLATNEILQDQNIFIFPARFGHNNDTKELIKRDGIGGFLNYPLDPQEILRTLTRDVNLQKTVSS